MPSTIPQPSRGVPILRLWTALVIRRETLGPETGPNRHPVLSHPQAMIHEDGNPPRQRKETPMRKSLAVIALLIPAVAFPLSGQAVHVTSTQIGAYRYYSGTVGTAPLSGSSYAIGSTDYTNLRVGSYSLNGTSTSIGSYRYSNWSDGRSSTTSRIGDYTYTRFNHGTTYTTTTIGDFLYTNGSDGSRYSTTTIGNHRYTWGQIP